MRACLLCLLLCALAASAAAASPPRPYVASDLCLRAGQGDAAVTVAFAHDEHVYAVCEYTRSSSRSAGPFAVRSSFSAFAVPDGPVETVLFGTPSGSISIVTFTAVLDRTDDTLGRACWCSWAA